MLLEEGVCYDTSVYGSYYTSIFHDHFSQEVRLPKGVRLMQFLLFFIGDWNAKVGSQETPGVTGKFGLGVRNEAGKD